MSDLLLNSLEIEGYRAFERLLIPKLGRVNLVVGKNNVGKTALLEALRLYAGKARHQIVREQLQDRDELPTVDPQDGIDRESVWEVKNLFFGRPDVRLSSAGFEIGVNQEPHQKLSVAIKWYRISYAADGDLQRIPVPDLPDLKDISDQSNVSAFLEAFYGEELIVAYPLNALVDPFGIETRKVEVIPAQFVPAQGLTRKEISDLWDRVALTEAEDLAVETLRTIAPELQRINFLMKEKSGRFRTPFAKLAGIAAPVALRSLGEGVNRLLGLTMSLVCAREGILLVDELETGFHYSIQAAVWQLLIQTASRLDVQIFVTTHSWDCIEAFQKASATMDAEDAMLVRLDNKSGNIAATLFDKHRLSVATREQIEVR